jgi:hypothetical protein
VGQDGAERLGRHLGGAGLVDDLRRDAEVLTDQRRVRGGLDSGCPRSVDSTRQDLVDTCGQRPGRRQGLGHAVHCR